MFPYKHRYRYTGSARVLDRNKYDPVFFKYFGKLERKCVKMPRNHGDSLMPIPQRQCFSNNYIWFINVVFRDEHLSNPFSILSAMLTATFLHFGCF